MRATFAFCLAIILLPQHSIAEDILDQAQSTSSETVRDSARSQQRINNLDDKTRQLLEAFRGVVRQSQLFQADAKLMQARVAEQDKNLAQLQQSLVAIDDLKRELTPLLQRMISQLESFIELDLPFKTVERLSVVETLQAAMVNPELNDTERFRMIVEAWQTEIDYGFELVSWRAILDDGERRMVTYLRLGRVGLYYQNLDGQTAGYWDNKQQRWLRLTQKSSATTIQHIQQGIRMARNQAAPELLALPLPPPQTKTIATPAAPNNDSRSDNHSDNNSEESP